MLMDSFSVTLSNLTIFLNMFQYYFKHDIVMFNVVQCCIIILSATPDESKFYKSQKVILRTCLSMHEMCEYVLQPVLYLHTLGVTLIQGASSPNQYACRQASPSLSQIILTLDEPINILSPLSNSEKKMEYPISKIPGSTTACHSYHCLNGDKIIKKDFQISSKCTISFYNPFR